MCTVPLRSCPHAFPRPPYTRLHTDIPPHTPRREGRPRWAALGALVEASGLPPGAKPTFSSVLGGHTRQATTGRTAQSARRREPQRLRRRAAATSPAQKWLKLTHGSRRDGPLTPQTWRGARPPPLLLLLLQPLSVSIFKGLFAQGPWRFFSFVNLFAAMRPFRFDRSSPEATQPRGARTVTCGKLEVLGSSTVYAMSLRRMWAWGVFSAVQPLRRIPRLRCCSRTSL